MMWREKKAGGWITGGIGLFLLVMSSILPFFFIRNSYMEIQKGMVGAVYERSPKICEEVLMEMFSEERTEEEVKKGEQALTLLGYTDQGAAYLYERTGWNGMYAAMLAMQAVVVLGLLGWMRTERGRKKREEEKIYHMEKVLETLRAKEMYLQKKEKQTQDFLENVAHQIRTPLSCISISLDLLLKDAKEGSKEKILQSFQYLEQIEGLLKRLLAIGRLEAGKVLMNREPIDVGNLFEECKASLAEGEDRIRMVWEEKERGIYDGDYEWLKEAFLNILKNCLEHGRKRGIVEVSLVESSEGIKVQIRDDGEGISPEDLPHIFDRFYIPRVGKASHTGIGLNLAKLVIEHHFGTIKAENHEKGGAVFSVVLPRYALKNGA